ncbi:MAG: signal peptidase II [Patescibacteria group bacterium]|nr:signal peptidase II [Patescibacteria group bacterium]
MYKRQQSVRISIVIFVVLFLDQICKLIILEKFADTYLKKNYTSLLGLSANLYLLFLLLLILLVYFKKDVFFEKNNGVSVAFALLLGGIISNSIDMFFYGYIVDYISIYGLFSFNIADLAICAGSLLLSWRVLRTH